MKNSQAVHEYIRQAQSDRSEYLAGLLKSAFRKAWLAARGQAESLSRLAQARTCKGIFTFDA